MFKELLYNPNPLISFGFAAFIAFVPLYFIASYFNAPWAVNLAIVAFISIIILRLREQGTLAFGG